MRSNEIINEGPIWQGIKSKLSGGTYTGGAETARGQAEIVKYGKMAEPNWFKAQAAYTQQGVTPAELPDQLTAWAKKWFETPALPDYKTSTKQQLVTNQGVRAYLQTAAAHQLAPDRTTPTAPVAPTTPTTPTAPVAPTTPTTPTAPVAPTTPTAPVAPTAPTTPTAPTAPEGDTVHAMFKNPTAFKAEWDKFMASNPNYKLIADPALLSGLKTMWMRTGGTKLENKTVDSSNQQVDEATPGSRKSFKRAVTPSVDLAPEPTALEIPEPTAAPLEPTRIEPTLDPESAAPAVGSSIFADPKKLLASFESFQEADGRLPPAFRGVLKDILLTALRTVESKNRKLNAIIKESKHLQKQVAALKNQKQI
jgi:hypothetical protein